MSRNITAQVCDVNKALLSVGKICDLGHHVEFYRNEGKIVLGESDEEIHFRRVDGVYRLRPKLDKSGDLCFHRPGN